MTPQRTRILLIIGIIFVVIILGVLLLSLLKGRGETNKGNERIKIVYWGLWEPPEVMEEVINDYEAQNQHIDIIYERKQFAHKDLDLLFSGAYYTSLVDRINSPNSIDIFRIHNSWLPIVQPYLSPVPTTVMTADEYGNTFYPVAYEDFVDENGTIYAIPLYIDGLVLFYNKDLYAEAGIQTPPTNWEQVVQASQKLRLVDNQGLLSKGGIGLGTGSNVSHAFEITMMMMTQANTQILNGSSMSFDSDRGVDAINYYLDFASGSNKVWSYGLRKDLVAFQQGDLGMMIGPSWRTFDIRDANQNLNFGIAKLPVLPGANPDTPQYYASYWAEAVSRRSAHPEEAWKFIKYLSEPEQLRRTYAAASTLREFGEPYPRRDMAQELINTPFAGVIVQMAPNMKSWQYGNTLKWEEEWRNVLIQAETQSNPTVSISNLLRVKEALQNDRDQFERSIRSTTGQ